MRNQFFTTLAILFLTTVSAQNFNVSGTITEADTNLPIISANIIIKNTNKGVVSDFDGNYTMNDVPSGSILEFSYVGFVTQEVVVNSSENINVVMQADLAQLDEVVIIGYGSQKKKEVTGAVSIVDAKTIEKLNPVRIEQALQGQVSGVNITSSSGSPGSGFNIRIRGISTNGDSKPLILVDGNPIVDLSVINPSDIKSINVLKDATAGIYGVQAANGVILITTKSGRKNTDMKFQLDAYTGFQETSKKIELLSATDFAVYVNDSADQTEFFVYPQQTTDWQDEVFETAAIYNLNFSANGGTEKSAYSFGMSYLDQDGIVGLDKSNYNRITARLNYQYDILENLKFSTTALHTVSEKNNLAEGGIGSVLYSAVNVNPNLSVRDQDGNYSLVEQITQIEIINPLAQIENTYNTSRVSKFGGTLKLDYSFWNNFEATSRFSINHANVRDDIYRPEVDYGPGKSANISGNEAVDHGADFDDFTWDNYLTYKNTFNDKHDLTVLLGTSIYRTKGLFYGFNGVSEDPRHAFGDSVWDYDDVQPRFLSENINNGDNVFDSRLSSIFTRLQYNYKGKYLLSAVMRRDGSTSFAPSNKYGYFPSGSVGWNVTEEAFLQDSSWLNNFKVRASYGVIGNDKIQAFGYVSLLNGQATIDSGNTITVDDLLIGSAIGKFGNPDIKWEKQKTFNIGFDASVFNNKVDIALDIYNRKTEDLLIAPEASALLGVGAPNFGSNFPIVNAGAVENKGVELMISYSGKITENLKFNTSFNMATIENKVLSVDVGGNGIVNGGDFGVGLGIQTSRMQAGLPIGYFYGYQTNGLYQTQAEIDALNTASPEGIYHENATPGDLKFVDTNGNGYIDADDRTYIGDPIPDVTFGFNLGFEYYNFDFSSSLFASVGNDMIRDYERKDLFANRGTYVLDRWQGTGTSNSVPRAAAGASINTDNFSDFYVEDASYLRLQNVQLGYNFGEEFLSSIGVDKLRIYVSGNNLFTITDYFGYDPSASSGDTLASGIDKGFYPVASSYLLGLNLNF